MQRKNKCFLMSLLLMGLMFYGVGGQAGYSRPSESGVISVSASDTSRTAIPNCFFLTVGAPVTITVSNTGRGPLNNIQVLINSQDSPHVTVTDNNCSSLTAGSNCHFTLNWSSAATSVDCRQSNVTASGVASAPFSMIVTS